MPLYDYKCEKCENVIQKMISRDKIDSTKIVCATCNVEMKRQFPIVGGYKMDSGPASVRPKGAGSRK